MTDRFTLIDAGLWAVAGTLLVAALWMVLRDRPENWDPAVFFGAALGALFGVGRLPLTGGPVPAAGWEGAPDDLDPVYAPAARLAPGLTWSDVVAGAPGVEAAVQRRLADVRLVWVEPPRLDIPGVAAEVVATEALMACFKRADERAVFVASSGAGALLSALHAQPCLRNRARAVLLIAPELDLAALPPIDHLTFEVEVTREVPYFTLRAGAAATKQLLPTPPRPASGILSIATIDLGILPEELLGDPRVARALGLLLAAI